MASYFMSSVVFSRAEGECKYSLRVKIQLTSEITWPYSTTSVISGLFYTSYSPVVSQDAAIPARISGSQ